MINFHQLKTAGVPFDGRYELKRHIGGGGFSEVWLAHDVRSDVDVALKVYSATQELDREGVRMFRREFSMVCRLNHTNILKPFTFDIFRGCPYIVLPFCEKGSAARLVGKIGEEELWDFTAQVAAGLAYMHRHDIIHQDIKPANVLINADEQYIITDFGVSTGLRNTIRMTCGAEAGKGTTEYMSYECLCDDPRNVMARDMWAFGATLYELMTGDVPFGKFGGMTQKTSGGTVPGIRNPAFSSELKELAYSCLALEPWDRPGAEEVVQMVEAHRGGRRRAMRNYRWRKTVRKRLLPLTVSLLALLTAGAAGAWWLVSGRTAAAAVAERSPADSLYMERVEQAAAMVSAEAEKSRLMDVDEERLRKAAEMYAGAQRLHPAGTVRRDGAERWTASGAFIDSTYRYMAAQSERYAEVGAEAAARHYAARGRRLKPFVSAGVATDE